MDDQDIVEIEKLRLIASTIKMAIKYGTFIVISVFFYLSIAELAGLETNASIVVDLSAEGSATAGLSDTAISVSVVDTFSKFRSSELLTYGILCAAVLLLFTLYIRERKLRLSKTESMSLHIESLEKLFDPNRTSSELTRSGTTNPEDK